MQLIRKFTQYVRAVRPRALAALIVAVALSRPALAQGTDPWETAVDALTAAFTGPIAKGLSLVAIVVGGLMFAFGESQSKRMFSGIIFGVGMAVSAVNFFNWMFQ